MLKRKHTEALARFTPVMLFVLLQLLGSGAAAQELSEIGDAIRGGLSLITDVIGPAIGICGLIYAGAMFFTGETGRPFKIGLGMLVGGVLIASAESIWTSFFGGNSVGG